MELTPKGFGSIVLPFGLVCAIGGSKGFVLTGSRMSLTSGIAVLSMMVFFVARARYVRTES